jgi:plastocyanin
MSNTFDSRSLGPGNCFGRPFHESGTFRYAVAPGSGGAVAGEAHFTVVVGEGSRREEGRQHNVAVHFTDSHFEAVPREIEVAAGDFVLWHGADAAVPPFAIAGEDGSFASDRLEKENVYTHVFGLAGEYQYGDARGSALAGTVRVVAPECPDEAALQRWREGAMQPALVMIERGRPKPSRLRIVVNQQVFFAVSDGPGVTITDKQLLDLPSYGCCAEPEAAEEC